MLARNRVKSIREINFQQSCVLLGLHSFPNNNNNNNNYYYYDDLGKNVSHPTTSSTPVHQTNLLQGHEDVVNQLNRSATWLAPPSLTPSTTTAATTSHQLHITQAPTLETRDTAVPTSVVPTTMQAQPNAKTITMQTSPQKTNGVVEIPEPPEHPDVMRTEDLVECKKRLKEVRTWSRRLVEIQHHLTYTKECLDAIMVTPGLLLTKTPQGRFNEGFHQKWKDVLHRASLELTELLHAEYELQLIEAREKLEFNLQFLTTISTDTNQEKVSAKKIENNNSTIQNFAGELARRCKKKMDANTRTPATAAPREPRLKPQPNLQKKYNIRDYENTQKVTFRNKQPHPPAECPRIAPLPTQ